MWSEWAWTQPSAETRARGLRWVLDVSETLGGGDQTGRAQKDRQDNVCSRSGSDSDCQSQKITSERLRWMRRDEIIGSQISSDKFLNF